MHDPKFEKEVQQKMHDLEFVPSESVWENIQREVGPRRRRRAFAAFWWWLVPGFVLLGTGVALYRHSTSVSVAASGTSGVRVPGGVPGGTPIVPEGVDRASSSRADAGADKDIGKRRQGTAAGADGLAQKTAGAEGLAHKTAGTEELAHKTTGAEGSAVGLAAPALSANESGGVHSGRAAYQGYRPGLISFILSSVGITAPRLYSKPVNTGVSGLPLPRRPWTAGFAAGTGISSVHASPAGQLAGSSNYLSALTPANPVFSTGPGANSAKRYASDIKPDISYWAGVFAEKPLSSRWSVDIGVDLHYYSTRLRGYQQAVNFAPSYASLLRASAITYAAPIAFSSGSELSYTNRYYYLEFPAAVQWKVNQSRVLPIFWRAGVVFSYLMASNALYYDEGSGSYYRDNGVEKHLQASVASGLMVGLPVKGVRMQAGPELQYGLTSMLVTSSTHLVYGGMRVAIMR